MRTHIGCQSRYFFAVACLLLRCVWLSAAENPDSAGMQIAAEFVRGSDCSGGVCAVVGRTDADLALALAGQGGFVVQALHTDAAVCEQVRRDIRAQGMYGSVSADSCLAQRLPYTDNLVNLLVVDSYTQLAKNGLSLSELLRVLTPLGTAYLGESATAAPAGWTDQVTSQLRSLGVEDFAVVEASGISPWSRRAAGGCG